MEHAELDQYLKDTHNMLEQSKSQDDKLINLYDNIKKIIPYDEIDIIVIDDEFSVAVSIDTSSEREYSLKEESIISQCYTSHQPLISNDLNKSLSFNKNIDTLNKDNITKILLIPILDENDTNVYGILWLGFNKTFKQFLQSDIDILIQFNYSIRHFFFGDNQSLPSKSEDHGLLATCRKSIISLKARIKRDEQFFAATVHDIRTPMNAIVGFVELMQLNERDELKKEYYDAILKSAEHIVILINDTLDMSKISNGQMTINIKEFDLLLELSDVSKLFYNSMRSRNIKFITYLDPNIPPIMRSDNYRIKQIINNLLSNAMKFTPSGGTIRFEMLYNKEQDIVKINVIDSGIGIAKDRQQSIFQPYTQEKKSTSSEYGGTGLGLSISQQLTVLLNGTLLLESEVGKGSVFTLSLPCDTPNSIIRKNEERLDQLSILIYGNKSDESVLCNVLRYLDRANVTYTFLDDTQPLKVTKKYDILITDIVGKTLQKEKIQHILDTGIKCMFVCDDDASELECKMNDDYAILHRPILPNNLFESIKKLVFSDETIESKASFKKEFKGYKALVVDDSRINLKLMKEILKKFKLEVVVATHGEEAIALYEGDDFNIVFIDQNMPTMNGDKVITQIKSIEKEQKRPRVFIYGLTGDSDKETLNKILDAGAVKVLEKPIHIQDIYDALIESSSQ